MIQEIQLDGLIGPTHFFGGLAVGNIASEQSLGRVSHPKAAALQGLKKMKLVHDLGIPQFVMPPHPRPALGFLDAIGFTGNAEQKIRNVATFRPELLPIVYSSSAMWAANAATLCASRDAANKKVHVTPANLISNAHRALEVNVTAAFLKRILKGDIFQHHAHLPYNPIMSDEGAANHMRLQNAAGDFVHVFVYGGGGFNMPKKYIARQHPEASYSIARLHQLAPEHVVFIQQHPDAIDAGVFHNDVIATSNDSLLVYHEKAFVDETLLLSELNKRGGFTAIQVSEAELSMQEAVKSYLFNSQILTLPDGTMAIVAPMECKQSAQASAVIERWIKDAQNPIQAVHYIDVNQSMSNGGGPACLRLRVWLEAHGISHVHQGVRLTDALYQLLGNWVEQYYFEQLTLDDLKHPGLPARVQKALLELETLLDLQGLYGNYC